MLLLLAAPLLRAQVQTIPYNESFETGAPGWSLIDGDGDGHTWLVLDYSNIPPLFRQMGYYAYDGTHVLHSAAYSDDDVPLSPSNWAISPRILVVSDDTVYISWQVKRQGEAAMGEIYEVWLEPSAGSTVDTDNFSLMLLSDTVANAVYEERRVALTDCAWQSIRIAFRHHGRTGGSSLQIDYLSIEDADLPVAAISGPATLDPGDTATYVAHLQHGLEDGLAFEWIADSADYVSDYYADTVRVVWGHGGHFNLGLIATNNSGADTTWLDVHVSSCPTVDSLPFTETFADDSPTRDCWRMLDADGNGAAWAFGDSCAQSSSVTFFGLLAPVQDNWLITPPIALDDDGCMVSWKVKAGSEERPEEHYSVYVSNHGTAFELANYDSLMSETLSDADGWQQRYLSLGQYGSDTVRIAFRHHDTDDQERLMISDFEVSVAAEPIIELQAPQQAIVGDSIPLPLSIFSVTNVLDIIWTIETDTLGNSVSFSTLNPFGYRWDEATEEGDYRLRVEVVNERGSAYDSTLVHLHVCNTVEELPYQHTFGTDEDCWRIGEGWHSPFYDSIQVDGTAVPAAFSFSHDELGRDLGADNVMASPWILIPDNTYELCFTAAGLRTYNGNASADRYTVAIRTTDSTDTIFTTLIGGGEVQKQRLRLADYSGERIQVVFRHHDSPQGYAIAIAQFEVRVVGEPEISISAPARAMTNETVAISAQAATSEALTYSWHLTGATPDTASGSHVGTVWTTPGTYTIALTVTSPLYGQYHDTTTITIIECVDVTNMPYTENFDVDLDCWQSIDLDGDGYGWEMAVGSSAADMLFAQGLAYGGQGNSVVSWSMRPTGSWLSFIFSGEGEMLDADDLLLSPTFNLPECEQTETDSIGWQFTFHAASVAMQTGDLFEGLYDQFELLLSTSDDMDIDNFTTLIPMQTALAYDAYTADLTPWCGQSFRLAVRHRSTAQLGLLVDEVSITSNTVHHEDPTEGIDEHNAFAVALYPNPAVDHVTIATDMPSVQACLYDMTGRKLGKWYLTTPTTTIDVDYLAPGTYILSLTYDKGTSIQKLTVSR